VPLPSVPLQDSKAALAAPKRLLDLEVRKKEPHAILETVRAAWRQEDAPQSKVSEVYRQKMQAVQSAEAGDQAPANGFRLALPLASTDGNSQAGMVFDSAAHKWFIQSPAGNAEIRFKGVVPADELPPEERPAAGLSLVLDAERKEFRLVARRAPVSLRAPEESPGELYQEILKRGHRRSQSARQVNDHLSDPESGE
jgi:hypothetical protein